MVRKFIAMTVAAAFSTQAACYNTYNVTLDELAKVQEGGSSNSVSIATSEGEPLVVTENSKVGVTDKDGKYHPISAFNFTMTAGQLVAPDEDEIIARDQIETGNVKVVSGVKTGLLVLAGLTAAIGAGVFVVITAPEKKSFGP